MKYCLHLSTCYAHVVGIIVQQKSIHQLNQCRATSWLTADSTFVQVNNRRWLSKSGWNLYESYESYISVTKSNISWTIKHTCYVWLNSKRYVRRPSQKMIWTFVMDSIEKICKWNSRSGVLKIRLKWNKIKHSCDTTL